MAEKKTNDKETNNGKLIPNKCYLFVFHILNWKEKEVKHMLVSTCEQIQILLHFVIVYLDMNGFFI